MIQTSKAYHALTGAELQQAIINEVTRTLDRAGINSPGITYPGVSWSWTLHLYQKDAEGQPIGETPEVALEAGEPSESKGSLGKLLNALGGGSGRYRDNPPSPSEVREQEKLPLPEA